MSDRLRDAVLEIREDWTIRAEHGDDQAVFNLAVAEWINTAATDLWAHGPLCCAEGCHECDDDLWMPHVRRALAVADAYLGGRS